MGKKKGFFGMTGQFSGLMNQLQQVQTQIKEIGTMEFTGTGGGGAVTARVSGKKELLELNIADEAVTQDIRQLEKIIAEAVNDGLQQAGSYSAQSISGIGGGLGEKTGDLVENEQEE